MMTPSCAEHGMAKAISAVAMRRSRSLPRMRVVMVAMVMQPKPRMMGHDGAAVQADGRHEPVGQSAAMRGR